MKKGTQAVLLNPDNIDLQKGLKAGDVFATTKNTKNRVCTVPTKHENIDHNLFPNQIAILDNPRKAIKAMLKHGISFYITTNGHNEEIIGKLINLGCNNCGTPQTDGTCETIFVIPKNGFMTAFYHETANHPKVNYTPKTKPQYEVSGGDYFLSFIINRVFPGQSTDNFRKACLEFKTKDAAEKAHAAYSKYHAMYKLAEHLNEGWEPDWSDVSELKWSIIYRAIRDERESKVSTLTKTANTIYFKSKETAEKAVKIINKNPGMFI